jgi:GDP-D-mannose dehydratase
MKIPVLLGRGLNDRNVLYRPAEVDLLISDPAKANKTLGWHPSVTSVSKSSLTNPKLL